MNIKITSKDGITLKTKDTYIREDISVAVDESLTGITPSGTYQVTDNGEYDITQYAKVNVNVASGGATIKTGSWSGTAIPNTGMLDKVYFNAEMPLSNIATLLSNLQYIQTPFIDVPIYPVLFTTNGVCGFITDDGNNKHRIYVAPDITDPSSSILIFSNLEGYGDKIGWQGLINPSWNNLDVNQNVISEYSGLPIGFENDKISSIISVTQFVETGESQEVLLEGEYDGSSVEITENTTLDIKSLIESDKRIPLSVNVNVPTGGGEMSLADAVSLFMENKGTFGNYLFYNANEELANEGIKHIGKFTQGQSMFYGSGLSGELKNISINMTQSYAADYIFESTKITKVVDCNFNITQNQGRAFASCVQLEEVTNTTFQTVNKTFSGCTNLKVVDITLTDSSLYSTDTFYNCVNLKSVTFKYAKPSTYLISCSRMFQYCASLTDLVLPNINANLTVGYGRAYGHLLTIESLIGLCQQCIQGTSTKTLTIGSENITKLSNVYVKLTGEAEENTSLPKLPMVQCESTDEGAMTINEYMTLKSWALA